MPKREPPRRSDPNIAPVSSPPINVNVAGTHTPAARSGRGGRAAYIRIVGYSAAAGFVLTVIVDPQDWSGVTAWKTRGADLRAYLEGKER